MNGGIYVKKKNELIDTKNIVYYYTRKHFLEHVRIAKRMSRKEW